MTELPKEPGLPDTGLPHDGHHLPVTGSRALERLAELIQLALSAHELGQAADGRGLEARADRGGPGQFVDLEQHLQPLDPHRAERFYLDVAFGQRQRLGRDHDRAGIGELLHPRGQVRRLADGGVVHTEIAADGADDDLA